MLGLQPQPWGVWHSYPSIHRTHNALVDCLVHHPAQVVEFAAPPVGPARLKVHIMQRPGPAIGDGYIKCLSHGCDFDPLSVPPNTNNVRLNYVHGMIYYQLSMSPAVAFVLARCYRDRRLAAQVSQQAGVVLVHWLLEPGHIEGLTQLT